MNKKINPLKGPLFRSTEIKNNFKLYSQKTESDYWVMIGGERRPTQATILTSEDSGLVKMDEKNPQLGIYEREFINRFHPDNIDSREFWKEATNKFPLFSITGGIQNINNVSQANIVTLEMAKQLGCLDIINDLYFKKPNISLLEIGPGYGGFQQYIADKFGDDHYYAIDVNPLFDHPRLYQTDGKTIPENVPSHLDAIYSVNVFQHLSKSQRTSYYKQLSRLLGYGGLFIFSMFVVTDKNKEWKGWGCKDKNGRIYTSFFKQLTEVDTLDELISELTGFGFAVVIINPDAQIPYFSFKCTKV